MITAHHISTESSELPIEEMIKEKEDLEQVSFVEHLKTSSEFQSPTIAPKIGLAHHPIFHRISQRLASGEEIEQLSHIKFKEILDSMEKISRLETLSSYPTLELEALEQLYIFRRRSEVIKFLVDNSFLFLPIQEAYEQIRNHFGSSAQQVVLEVVTDPEVAGDQELVIFIRTNLSPDEAYKKLKQLDEEWWLDAPANVRKKLCIDVEFE